MRPDERASALLLPLMYAVMGRPYPRMVRELRASERMPSESLDALRLERLRRLVRHCRDNVPYYRELLGDLGMGPDDLRTLEDFERIPPLDKETLRERSSEFVADGYPVSGMRAVSTSGSTGAPLTVYHDPAYFDWGWAALLRDMEWTGHRPGERQAWIIQDTGPGGLRRSLRLAIERKWVGGSHVHTPADVARWVAELQRRAPVLVYSTPSSRLAELSSRLLERGVALDSVRVVMTSSEALLDPTRERIEEAFGARVFNQYGATECLSIASECEAGSMHVNAETNLVEWLPVDAATDIHEIVVTPLMCYGMPLLRYRLGDLGRPVAGPCACGRTLPLMRILGGRRSTTVTLPDGTVITHFALGELIEEVPGIARFQFRQTGPDSFDVLVVSTVPGDTAVAAALTGLTERFERLNGVRLGFRVRFVDDIPLTAGGKHLYVVPLEGSDPARDADSP